MSLNLREPSHKQEWELHAEVYACRLGQTCWKGTDSSAASGPSAPHQCQATAVGVRWILPHVSGVSSCWKGCNATHTVLGQPPKNRVSCLSPRRMIWTKTTSSEDDSGGCKTCRHNFMLCGWSGCNRGQRHLAPISVSSCTETRPYGSQSPFAKLQHFPL